MHNKYTSLPSTSLKDVHSITLLCIPRAVHGNRLTDILSYYTHTHTQCISATCTYWQQSYKFVVSTVVFPKSNSEV